MVEQENAHGKEQHG